MQIQKFTIVSNPKGGKKTPSIRICSRHVFHVFSTSYEKRFSIKMTLFSSRFNNLISSRTPREEIKRPLSESAFDTFFMFSRHLMKNVFLSKWHFFQADSKLSIDFSHLFLDFSQLPLTFQNSSLTFHNFSLTFHNFSLTFHNFSWTLHNFSSTFS